jgi:sterol 14-demethylase
VVSPTVSHRIPEVFPEPDLFDPDRYLPDRAEDKQDFAYIAFGGGRHKCLGNAFAILQIKAILALLLGQFDFGLCGDAITDDFHGLVIGPKEPCRIRYRRREEPSVTMAMGEQLAELAKRPEQAAPAGCPAHAKSNGEPASGAAEPKSGGEKSLLVKIDRDLCQGHGVCAAEAPELFAVGRDEKVIRKVARPAPEQHDAARAAAEYCPTRTIRIEE